MSVEPEMTQGPDPTEKVTLKLEVAVAVRSADPPFQLKGESAPKLTDCGARVTAKLCETRVAAA